MRIRRQRWTEMYSRITSARRAARTTAAAAFALLSVPCTPTASAAGNEKKKKIKKKKGNFGRKKNITSSSGDQEIKLKFFGMISNQLLLADGYHTVCKECMATVRTSHFNFLPMPWTFFFFFFFFFLNFSIFF
jgi:hypothetical protein